MPKGYAQVLLDLRIDGVTKGLESVTSSGIGQWLTGLGLAAHGARCCGWVSPTAAAVFLGNGLVSLAGKFGLAQARARPRSTRRSSPGAWRP